MKAEYDFSRSRPNPYLQDLPKREVTIVIEEDTLDYFSTLAERLGVPYQQLMTLYLRDCARLQQQAPHERKRRKVRVSSDA